MQKAVTDADIIVNNLRNTARAIITDLQIKKDFAHIRELRQKYNEIRRQLARTLNHISHRTKLDGDSCSYTGA